MVVPGRPAALHVANGAETRRLLEAALPGQPVASNDDVLIDGPLPRDALVPPSPGWAGRAAWMAREHGADAQAYLAAVAAIAGQVAAAGAPAGTPGSAPPTVPAGGPAGGPGAGSMPSPPALVGAPDAPAIVAWADAGCAHCAANLVWLLSLPTAARWLLVRPPGARLGGRDAATLSRLAGEAVAVPAAHVAWAGRAWHAMAEGSPALQGFLLREGHAWPELAADLRLRAELPRLLDEALVRWLEWQPLSLAEMMERLAKDRKVDRLGLGDASLLVRLRALAAAGTVRQDGGQWRLAEG